MKTLVLEKEVLGSIARSSESCLDFLITARVAPPHMSARGNPMLGGVLTTPNIINGIFVRSTHYTYTSNISLCAWNILLFPGIGDL